MAESEHDDLADALARMSGEDPAPSEAPPPPTPAARPVAKPVVRPITARPIGPVTAAPPRPPAMELPTPPVTPRPIRPAAPALGNAPPPAAGSRPSRPVAPALSSTPGAARKERPIAPTLRQVTIAPTDAETDSELSTGLTAEASRSEIIDDDDSVIMPAPEASVFTPKSKSSAEMRAKLARKKNLEFRRTLIPILLTCGTLMLTAGVLRFFTGSDSMLADLPIWIPIVLLAAGAIILALAVVNMISVKQQLAAQTG